MRSRYEMQVCSRKMSTFLFFFFSYVWKPLHLLALVPYGMDVSSNSIFSFVLLYDVINVILRRVSFIQVGRSNWWLSCYFILLSMHGLPRCAWAEFSRCTVLFCTFFFMSCPFFGVVTHLDVSNVSAGYKAAFWNLLSRDLVSVLWYTESISFSICDRDWYFERKAKSRSPTKCCWIWCFADWKSFCCGSRKSILGHEWPDESVDFFFCSNPYDSALRGAAWRMILFSCIYSAHFRTPVTFCFWKFLTFCLLDS